MKATKTISILISCLAIIAFLMYQFDIFPEIGKGNDKEKNIFDEYNEKKEETESIIENERKEKNGETINKDQLIAMILDSSLHFDNVKGEYTLVESSKSTGVEYSIDMVGLKSMHYYRNDEAEYTLISQEETKKTITIDDKRKVYRISKWVPSSNEDLNPLSVLDRLYKGLSKDSRAENLIYGDVINSHFVQSLKYYIDWEFNEIIFLDLPSYLIQGIDSNYADGDKFEMVIEKNTGILLDYHLFNKDGEEIISIITKSIQIDSGIDEADFEWDPTGYEKVGIPSYVPEEYVPDDEEE